MTESEHRNRRQFERFHISAEAIAVATDGQRLGRVFQAGGGGLGIRLEDASPAPYRQGERLRFDVVEPETGVRHHVVAEVKYLAGGVLGLEFARYPEEAEK